MNLIDMHCDTISVLHEAGMEKRLFSNDLEVDIQKMKNGHSKAQFFALFLHLESLIKKGIAPFEFVNDMLVRFNEEMELNRDFIRHAKNLQDMEENEKQGLMSAFLTIEEGGALEGSIENLREIHSKGVSLITLTWNFENELGYPNCNPETMNKGLKERGIEFVEAMNEFNMLIDVSHLSDGGFYDVLKHSRKPFVASHSNARSITNHPRNMTDDMIKALSNKGGVMGLNFCSAFLNEKDRVSRIEYMVEHLKHIRNIGGIDVMAMGTDFDGIGCELEMKNIGEMNKLVDALQKANFTENDIEKIFHKNVERVIGEVLR
ncbi:membrane dipeptidase [Hathewaya proteolytica DSM 3090]|uniref:Membrane dipeptidase n=1 Tax=Hathewaya proteolytica DSM 3090 TaxID=1121331 RepID=A0A1M6SJR1_9CLOT|nr:dipeptidase [Hathewaya proteolytica]SHK44981.1 membrane dipeptidase [Hathewaya proteolytica DSM 3090]